MTEKAPRGSFFDRSKSLMLAMPADLDPSTKLVLLALFMFASDAGGGIYPSNEHLCTLLGMPRSTLFRHLKILGERGFLHNVGWKSHSSGCRTRLRKLDLESIRSGVESPTHGTGVKTVESPTHETRESPTHGTQTKSLNREGKVQERISRVVRARAYDDIDEAVGVWNVMAEASGLSCVTKALTERRKIKVRERLNDAGGLAGWRRAIELVRLSPFLLGQHGAWQATFDFVLREDSFVRLMEGCYSPAQAQNRTQHLQKSYDTR